VKGASIWGSGNRFITVHSTQYVSLLQNVGYKAVGHGFFLESGDEVFVEMDGNLGIMVTRGEILSSDRYPAVFWIQNPANSLRNNIAVSSIHGSGFELAIPGGSSDIPALGGRVVPQKLPLFEFVSNEAHSNARFGLKVYRLNPEPGRIRQFNGLLVWRNGGSGLHLSGNRMMVSEATLFGNGRDTYNANGNILLLGNFNHVENSVIKGELEAFRESPNINGTLTGILLLGENNTVAGVNLEGHNSRDGLTGSDISLRQGSNRPITAIIEDTVMSSPRTILFGYPLHEESMLQIRGFQNESGTDFDLVRVDVNSPIPCVRGYIEVSFVAKKCDVE